MTQASIITIGDELLIGQVIDTNSAYIAQKLNTEGIAVKRRIAVGDIKPDIVEALDTAAADTDIIIITGGLGPTADDITKPLLCEYFAGKMVEDKNVLVHIEQLFASIFNRPITDRNRLQAMVPDVCNVLHNKVGTAPGMLFKKGKKVFMSLPGVPHEMRYLVDAEVIPYVSKHYPGAVICHETLLTFGIGESNLADLLIEFEAALPLNIKLAYLPNYGLVRLRLSGMGTDRKQLESSLANTITELKKIVSKYLVTDKDDSMQVVLQKLLQSRNETVSTAESCTGGYIAHLLTSIPGSSSWYEGSVVSYSYSAKEDLLQVPKTMLLEHGAVSEEVVTKMAEGALKSIHATYTIAVSGIMGPGGGMPDKPVGTVWMAAGNRKKIITKKLQLRFDRKKNIEITAIHALNLLRLFIVEESKK